MTETTETTAGFVDVGDARLRFWERGQGEAVLLCHAGVFGEWFAPVFNDPALDNVRLIRIHRAGYGESSPPRTHLTFADHARHCRTLLHELGADRAYWVGHSSSGSIGIQAALDEPDLFAGLILLESAPSPAGPSAEEMFRTTVGPAIGAAQGGDIALATQIFLAGLVGAHWGECIRQRLGDDAMEQIFRDARMFFTDEIVAASEWSIDAEVATRLTTPTLLAYGAEGWRATRSHEETARALHDMLPNAELVTVPGVGHGMPLEDPTTVARLIADAVSAWSASTKRSGPPNNA